MEENPMAEKVELRAFTDHDRGFLTSWASDPDTVGQFEWFGFMDPLKRLRRFEKDGYISPESTALAVCVEGEAIGVVSFWPKRHGGPPGACFEWGLALLPDYRGRGVGSEAQRLILHYLFNYTTANRVEGLTDSENVVTQHMLGKAGFVREGVVRGCYFHRGSWRDLVLYGLLREDYKAGE
jgi:RimJ/RimL family protein N-acetyltransferase